MGFSDRDRGAKKLQAGLGRRATKRLHVGVVGAAAEQQHPGDPDGLTNARLMAIHEIGVPGRIPARSWLRGWFDETQAGIRDAVRKLARRVFDPTDPLTEEQALEQLGLAFAADIQERIAEGIDPPNHPRTIARKGSSIPLIDTGHAKSTITYEVRDR